MPVPHQAAPQTCRTETLGLTSVICTILMMMALFGAIQAGAGLIVVRAFARTRSSAPAILPSVTILKPVCGDEPLLAEAIQSCCVQDYPCFQLLIGAQDADDPALGVARQLQARFPACDIGIIVDPKLHGPNRKADIGFADALGIEALLHAVLATAILVPGYAGVQEAAYAGVGALFGQPAELALAVSLLRRARDVALGVPILLAWQMLEWQHRRRRQPALNGRTG